MSKLFYIQDTTSRGDLVLWWKPGRSGYTVKLNEAGLYPEEEARLIASIRGTDIPRSKEEVDAAAIRVVSTETARAKWGKA